MRGAMGPGMRGPFGGPGMVGGMSGPFEGRVVGGMGPLGGRARFT